MILHNFITKISQGFNKISQGFKNISKGFNNISNGLKYLWLVLMIASAGSLADVADYSIQAAASDGTIATVIAIVGLICVVVLKATVLTAMYAVCSRNKWLKYFAVIVIAVFILLSVLNGFCWLFYGFGISMKLFKIIMETNPGEVEEFIPEVIDKVAALPRSVWFWVFILLFAAAWKWLPNISSKWMVRGCLTLSVFGFGYFIYVFSTAEFGRLSYSVLARSGRCVVKYIHERSVIRELQAQKRPLLFPESIACDYAADKVIVVIGESVSRDHMSLYGYPLSTTPRLDSLKGDLYLFCDAVASSSSTAENMPRLLTFMTDEPNQKEWYDYPSVLQIFKKVGYRTYWISNQEYSGQWSNLSSILSSDADVVKYVGSMDSEDHFLYRYDDALMPEWNSVVHSKDSVQLIFLHMMGSHFQYDRRFPPERRVITGKDVMDKLPRKWLDTSKAEIIANYDNSIRYTDSILSLVLKDIKNNSRPAIMIYLSDHGEDVYDDRDFRGRDSKFVEVPFFVYANDAYRHKNPGIIMELERASSVPFSTSELPQILMHLSGINYAFADSLRNPLSASFKVRKRWVDQEVFYRDAESPHK